MPARPDNVRLREHLNEKHLMRCLVRLSLELARTMMPSCVFIRAPGMSTARGFAAMSSATIAAWATR
jgi:hypothetical protein